ncbi:MAG: hypothetical protein JWP89_3381 [Schlesneria sp.]|nr:hypothetical protein [Schlesneria sp.]
MTIPKNLLTAKVIAQGLGVSLSTVYRLKQNGNLPHVQPGGKRHFVRFPHSVLDSFNESNHNSQVESTTQDIPGPTPNWLAGDSSR